MISSWSPPRKPTRPRDGANVRTAACSAAQFIGSVFFLLCCRQDGPYIGISECLVSITQVANGETGKKTQTTNIDDLQIPRPDLRFRQKETTAKQTREGTAAFSSVVTPKQQVLALSSESRRSTDCVCSSAVLEGKRDYAQTRHLAVKLPVKSKAA